MGGGPTGDEGGSSGVYDGCRATVGVVALGELGGAAVLVP